MNLIAYSDSEESDTETKSVPQPIAKPAPKPAFQKIVDRSNPGKIRVNLPALARSEAEKDDIEVEARPAKRARIGGGAFGGFNAMLPAPKKPNASATTEATAGKKTPGKGLGSGINLKTGAEPAFKREPKVEEEEYDENGNPVKKQPMKAEDFRAMLNLPPPKKESQQDAKAGEPSSASLPEAAVSTPAPAPKPKAKPRFMPLSVARGMKKKPVIRPPVTVEEPPKPAQESAQTQPIPEAKPTGRKKVSLFSMAQEPEETAPRESSGQYQPLLYGTEEGGDLSVSNNTYDTQSAYQSTQYTPSSASAAGTSNELTSIASELNLTEAEKRQLFGRKGRGPDLSSAKIVDFNTDQEYLHNEQLRQQGETVQHNALKSITGTGKNSLKGLVNMAVTQKDALEEHFAAGRRNKKEAGNRYGW